MEKKALDVLMEAESYGLRKQKDGTVLLGHIPHVAPEAFLHVLFAPTTEKEITSLEKQLKANIPSKYQAFLLKEYNGLIVFGQSLYLNGYRKNYDRTSKNIYPFDLLTVNKFERPSDAEETDFFIGGYDWDGSLLYMKGEGSKIFRCSRENVEPLNSWTDLDSMLSKEIRRLSGFFKDGKKKKEDQPTTP